MKPQQKSKRLPGPRGEATDSAYQNLFRLAHELGPNAKLPPVRDLRERFGVSQSTLDAALDRLERQHILLRRERSGVYVASGLRDRNICLLYSPHCFVRFGDSPFWSALFQRIQEKARSSGIRLTVAFSETLADDTPPEQLVDPALLPHWLKEEITAEKIHGVLSIGMPHPAVRWIEGNGVPVVAFAGGAQYIVAMSYSSLIQMAVATLVRQGCRRIALWRLPHSARLETNVSFFDATFVGALAAHGLTLETNGRIDDMIVSSNTDAGWESVGWELALRQFGSGGWRPDGVVVETDMIAHGGLSALQRLGVQIGEEVKIATHANKGLPVLRAWEDRIWRLEYDMDELVGMMFETIEALLGDPGTPPELQYGLPDGATESPQEHFRMIYPRLAPPSPHLSYRVG